MSLRISSIGFVLAVLVVAPKSGAPADDPKKPGELSASDLHLEVSVLRTLYYLKTTPEQAEALLRVNCFRKTSRVHFAVCRRPIRWSLAACYGVKTKCCLVREAIFDGRFGPGLAAGFHVGAALSAVRRS